MSNKVPQIVVPDVSREVGPQTQRAFRQMAQVLQQHEQAFAILKPQIDAKNGTTTTKASTAVTTPTATPASTTSFGKVNNQTGASYTLQDGDYGGLTTLSDANPVALALNTACRQFWFGAVQNLGPGIVTVTPPSGAINGSPSIQLPAGDGAWIFFDGTNWWAVSTFAQPSFANISGQLAASQLPVTPITATVALAALTPTGAQGSMTFTDGILTAYSAPS